MEAVERVRAALERANDSWAGRPYPVGPGVSQEFVRAVQDRSILADELRRLREERDEAIEERDESDAELLVLHNRAEAAERERDNWHASNYAERQARLAAERALAEMRTTIAQQLTPLDVAATHIDILRRKGDEYSGNERDNVAAIVESHVREARTALFAALRPTSEVRYDQADEIAPGVWVNPRPTSEDSA